MSSENANPLTKQESSILLISILFVALCGIVYELIIGTVSSYLLGNSVLQFSLTIGVFMFAMGIGSLISKYFDNNYLRNFIIIEILIALFGGVSSILLFVTFPFAREMYTAVMYALILIIGGLVGTEIPILSTLLAKQSSFKESIANVLSLDYIGALIGSVAFPLVLLPSLGLVLSSFAVGLANIGVALVNVYVFRKRLKHAQVLMHICISTLIVLILCIFYGSAITRFAEQHLYFDQVIYSKQTAYQKLVITRSKTTRDQRLYIDGHIQFSSKDEYRYHEFLVHPLMSIEGNRQNILILGGGDGLAVREILKYDDVARVDLVDIDPEMIRIGKEQTVIKRLNEKSLHSDKVTTYAADAFSFINQPGILYDRVIIDMPDPHNEAINKLYSKEFYTMIAKRLSPDGIIVSQSSSPFFTRNVFWSIESTLNSVLPYTLSYSVSLPSFGIWGFNMASTRDLNNEQFNITVNTRSITNESFAASRVFTKDIAKSNDTVNSIMEPKLYHIYTSDLSH